MKILTLMSCVLLVACGGGGGSAATSPPVTPPPTTTAIADVQGSSASSPLDGQTVTVAGIVTGDFQDNDGDADVDHFLLNGLVTQSRLCVTHS